MFGRRLKTAVYCTYYHILIIPLSAFSQLVTAVCRTVFARNKGEDEENKKKNHAILKRPVPICPPKKNDERVLHIIFIYRKYRLFISYAFHFMVALRILFCACWLCDRFETIISHAMVTFKRHTQSTLQWCSLFVASLSFMGKRTVVWMVEDECPLKAGENKNEQQ